MSSWTGIFGTDVMSSPTKSRRNPWSYMDSVSDLVSNKDESSDDESSDHDSDDDDFDETAGRLRSRFSQSPGPQHLRTSNYDSFWGIPPPPPFQPSRLSPGRRADNQSRDLAAQPPPSAYNGGRGNFFDSETMEDERSGLDFAAAGGAAGMAGFGQAAAGANQMDTPKESGIYPRISMATTTESPSPVSKLSTDSLAFTLVYCSVFMVTLLYIGVRLARKWRRTRQGGAARADTSGGNTQDLERNGHTHNGTGVTCNHAVCHQAAAAAAAAASNNSSGHYGGNTPLFPQVLPYSGLGALWIPEIMSLDSAATTPAAAARGGCGQQQQHVHTVQGQGRCGSAGCENCQRLTQPPPSYTKLFLEEQPPTYTDAVGMESAAGATSAEASAASLPSVSCSPVSPPPPPPNNAAVPDEGDKTCSDSSPSGSSENLPLISLSSEASASTGCSPTQNNGVHLPTAPEAVPFMPAEAETSTTPPVPN